MREEIGHAKCRDDRNFLLGFITFDLPVMDNIHGAFKIFVM